MGYRRPRKTYRLKFGEDSGDLNGLEAVFGELSIDQLLRLVGTASGLAGEADIPAKLEKAEQLFAEMAKGLHSWNLEDDDGTPVPASYEGVAAQGLEFTTAIVTAWIEAMSSVDIPLPPSSNGGQRSAEEESSLQLASLSKSLPS